jgi:hypothetical protein
MARQEFGRSLVILGVMRADGMNLAQPFYAARFL